MRSTKIAAVLLAGALSVSLAACGDDEDSASSTPSSTNTAPIAGPITDLSKGVSTAVALDKGFTDALTARKVTPGTVGKATISAAGVASFPITGGNVTVFDKAAVDPYVTGEIEHEGSGLSLTAGGLKVELTDFVVNPGTSLLTGKVTAGGKVAAESANLFFLDGTNLQPLKSEGTNAILTGTVVKLHPDAAALLNATYKLTGDNVFPDFFTIGVATITVATA